MTGEHNKGKGNELHLVRKPQTFEIEKITPDPNMIVTIPLQEYIGDLEDYLAKMNIEMRFLDPFRLMVERTDELGKYPVDLELFDKIDFDEDTSELLKPFNVFSTERQGLMFTAAYHTAVSIWTRNTRGKKLDEIPKFNIPKPKPKP